MPFSSASDEAFSRSTVMAPHQVDPSQPTNLECLLIHTIYALSFCILLCILILFRQTRNQGQRSDLREHALESDPKDQGSTHSDQHLTRSMVPLTGSSHTVHDSSPMRSGPVTSGYLASAAKAANARKVDFEVRARGRKLGAMANAGPSDETRSIYDEPDSSWRRHSYPQPSQQGGLLHDNSSADLSPIPDGIPSWNCQRGNAATIVIARGLGKFGVVQMGLRLDRIKRQRCKKLDIPRTWNTNGSSFEWTNGVGGFWVGSTLV
ncbi:hypothetical protein Z517_12263 [Fonsecaea pedrosoi CBS 271.37]|uniref:Unplaced genomic scaffold supercont1.9, whole genome shotgun sequence n=1 Tax=Fonsecaea pedrosoi CBS 271.37 TaxID=1442368 RepID=A0A0D2G0K3_9EURO|nr:uncharacterized protein Z517_12263 [Fonsecaea pedrosoi CBS 271.37]KIW74323.1 hypothetical protein Z517_12263 [Fonsecaea pedrosoi CBS 271.37]